MMLWDRLRSGILDGARFRRQHSVGPYIVDFYCWKARLAVELDGPYHDRQVEEDAARDEFLRARGIRVLRFKNEELDASIEQVLTRIRQAISESQRTISEFSKP